MIISCPSCDAQYLLPDDAIGPKGRRVKCTSCAYTWLQHAEDAHEAHLPVTDEDTAAAEREEEERRKRRQALVGAAKPVFDAPQPQASMVQVVGSGLMWGAGAFLVLFLCAIGLKNTIVAAWQPSALIFETIGMPADVPGKGLEFKDINVITTATAKEGGTMGVKGSVANTTKAGIFLPNLRIRLEGPSGWLKDWDIGLGGKYLPSGKSISFEYTLEDAPANGKNVTLIFIN